MPVRRVLTSIVLAGGSSLVVAFPASAATNQVDRTWIVAAHQSNLSEIAAGTAAQQHATTATVKNLGKMFITDHTTQDAALKTLAARVHVALPDAPTPAQQAALAAVKQHTRAGFDSAWIAAQLAGHLQALTAGKLELARGSDPVVLAADRAAAAVVQRHYNELKAAAGSSPTSVSSGSGGQAAQSPVTPQAVGLSLAGLLLLLGAGFGYLRSRRHVG